MPPCTVPTMTAMIQNSTVEKEIASRKAAILSLFSRAAAKSPHLRPLLRVRQEGKRGIEKEQAAPP